MLIDRIKNLGQITEVETGNSMNSAELRIAVQSRIEVLRKQGIQSGSRFRLENGNTISFFIDLLALWSLDACAVPVDMKNPQQKHLEKSVAPAAPAHLILYTSGTTGVPKEIGLSLAFLEKKLQALECNIPLGEITRTLCVLPTHFGHGLIGNCLFPLLTGQHLFITPAFSAAILFSVAEIVDLHKITFLSSVPSIWRMLRLHPGPKLQSLNRIHCASAAFTEELFGQISLWAPGARIFNVFGTTELASWVTGHEIKSPADYGCVGFGWGCQIRINENAAVEICLSGGNIWHNTGDIGRWEENSGLRLIGRSDDIMNIGGLKVHPTEVEARLRLHPEVDACCVFSLPHEISGECIAAAVVLKKSSTLTASQLESWCREHLVSYRVPTKWFFVPGFLTDERGKISRHRVRALCLSPGAGHESQSSGKVR